jgi:PTS system mannose-specific IIA component
MVGFVVASHGRLAEELLTTARQIVGEVPHAIAVTIEAGTPHETIRARVREAVKAVDEGQGVLVFADLLGGTPCNQSLTLCATSALEVITGVNLPLLIKANALRAQQPTLAGLAAEVVAYGQKSICCASAQVRAELNRGDR